MRLNPIPVLRGHLKGLTNDHGSTTTRDWISRVLLFGSSLTLGFFAWKDSWALPAAMPILAGVALLAGGTLTAFSAISTLRLRLTDRADDESLDFDRDAIDESVAHLLTVSLLCVIDAVLIVVGLNVSPDGTGGIVGGVLAASIIAASAYVALLFVLVIPRLYSAYVGINKVSEKLSGFTRGRIR